MSERPVDVAIVGAGPAGLSAAAELKRQGVEQVIVLEREASGGGVPRHCGHPPYGIREFKRLLTGPAYARRLVDMATAAGVIIRLQASVVDIETCKGLKRIRYSAPDGIHTLLARRVLLATGTRESPRSARLASGERPPGVMNTGALQAYAYLEHIAPFRSPVIIGTELVALSAILTCRSLGARPVAMIEEGMRPVAPIPYFLFPRMLGIPVLTETRLADISGNPRVTHVTVEATDGRRRDITCDGVIFSGEFISESDVARRAGVRIDRATGGPEIDRYGRTSDPLVFAAGNLLRAVETAGWSFREGRSIGGFMAEDLIAGLPVSDSDSVIHLGNGLRYAMPQRLSEGQGGLSLLQLRVDRPIRGALEVRSDEGRLLYRRRIDSLPERRITLPLRVTAGQTGPVTISVDESP